MPVDHRGMRVLPIKDTQRPGKESRACAELGRAIIQPLSLRPSSSLSRFGLETLHPIPQHLAVKQLPILGSLQPPGGLPSAVPTRE
jgi:hypothetical protein